MYSPVKSQVEWLSMKGSVTADLELNVRMVFMERNIQDQLICDEDRPDMRILWHRKCIEATEVGDQIERREYDFRVKRFPKLL
ncbi:hypothetical protein Y032_0057g2756 [Ancylostoma ceylanicum]|uniref:Uncharacterized protein n=2 Tax=Ancylostoma ceylanicum TaxID=53326 RepID=A0A016U693_9BILA|nr:hypothetical protein Y032_0057g2756 [Ancylostoma ceylanicum]